MLHDRRLDRGPSKRPVNWPRRHFLVVFLLVASVLLLPIAASGMSTGPGGDASWNWQKPLPQGNDLLSQSWVGTTGIGWAVGRNGTVIKSTDNGASWVYQDPGISATQAGQVDLTSVVATDSGNVVVVAGANGVGRRSVNGGATWSAVAFPSNLTGITINSIAISGSRIVAVGNSGRIAYSTDSGVSWTAATQSATTADLSAVCFATMADTTWFATTVDGRLLRSTDSGVTWASVSTSTYAFTSVAFRTASLGVAVGRASGGNWVVLRTTTGGASWTPAASPENTDVLDVDVLSANTACVVTASGSMYKTTNLSGTFTWTKMGVGHFNAGATPIRSLFYASAVVFHVVGDGGLIARTGNGGTSWLMRSSVPTAGQLMASWFADSTHGWAVGANGIVQMTADGGATWTGSSAGTATTTWRGVCSSSATTGTIVGDNGYIMRTGDSGATWVPQTSGITTQLNAVYFASETVGLAVGTGGVIRSTVNGGTTWAPVTSGITDNLFGVYMPDTTHAYVVGANSRIRYYTYSAGAWNTGVNQGAPVTGRTLYGIRGIPGSQNAWIAGSGGAAWQTTNNGSLWTALTSNTTQDLYSVHFRTTTAGIIGGANGTVSLWNGSNAFNAATTSGQPSGSTVVIRSVQYPDATNAYYFGDGGASFKSTDGGANWSTRTPGSAAQLNAISFFGAANGWAAGNAGQILRSTDSGVTWFAQASGVTTNLNGISFGSATTGLVVGNAGVIRRTTNAGATWASQASGTTQNLNAVACSASNPNYGIAVGAQGTIRFTVDGSAWAAATTVPALSATDNMVAVSYASTSSTEIAYIAVGHAANNGHPSILRTANHGQTWTAVASMNQPPSGIRFAPAPSSSIGWASAAAGFVYKTVDGGLNWTTQTTPITTAFTGISAVTSQSAFAVGSSGVIAQTANGGTTWLTQNSGFGSTGAAQNLLATEFTDANHGFAVGTGGAILRTINQTPPSTSVTLNPSVPDGLEGWYRATIPQVTLTPDQAGQTYYSWAGATGPFTSYSSALTPTEGARTLYFYSVNSSNRTEPVMARAVNSDRTPPSTPLNVLGAPIDSTSAQVSWNPSTDAGSLIDHYELWYRIGAGSPTRVTTTSPIVTSAMATELTANTTYSFWVSAYDHAGNVSANSAVVDVSTTALGPLSTTAVVTPTDPNGLNGWYTATPTVSFTVTPNVPAYTHYAWDGSDLETYTLPVQMSVVGAHTLSFWSEDQAGLHVQELAKAQVLRLDTTSPSAPAVTASGASTSSLEVSWTAANDAQSGVDHYELWVGGAPRGTYTGTSAVVDGLEVNRDYSVYVVTFNAAGLTSMSTSVIGHTLANPAVSTSAARVPATPNGLNGWYTSGPTITLTALPSTVPCWSHYSWDGGAETTYTAAFTVPSDGAHTVSYYSVDRADAANLETPAQTMTVHRDTVAPSPPTTVVPQSVDTTTIVVNWTFGSDATSGMDHYALYVDGVFLRTVDSTSSVVSGLLANRLYSFAVASVDAAGNESAQTTPVYAATSAAPALVTGAASSPAVPDGSNGWYVTTPTVTFSVTPLVAAYTRYAWDASALATATGPITMPVAGSHTLSYWSIDQAGERAREATQQLVFRLDRTAPIASVVSASALSTSSLLVSWTPSYDPESGVDYYELFVDGASYNTYVGMSAIVGGFFTNTPHQLVVRTHNIAGRTADSAMVIGTTAANQAVSTDYAISPAAPNGANGWYVTTPTVTLASTPTVLPAWTHSWWDASAPATYTVPVSVPSQGAHDLHFYSVDQVDAGNREATRTLSLKYDSGVPSPPTTVIADMVNSSSIHVEWTFGADAASGVDHYQLYVDGVPHSSWATTGTTVSGFAPATLHTFAVVTYDAAGNASAQSPTTMATTGTSAALSTTAQSSPAAPDGANGWYITNPAITLASSPTTVAAYTRYAWDSSALATYTAPVSASSDGQHTLSFWSIDQAGERTQEATQQATYRIDTSAPSQPSGVSAVGDSTTSLAVTWTAAADAHSAINHYEVWVGGTMRGTTASTSLVVGGLAVNTAYSVHVVAVNTAGLTATSTNASGTTLSNTAVYTDYALSPAAANGANGWYVSTPTVTLTSMPTTLPAWTYSWWDASTPVTYTVPVSLSSQGAHDLHFYSVDQADAGNRETTRTLPLRLDTGVPSPPIAVNTLTLGIGSIGVDWSFGADSVSGVDHYQLYVDGALHSSETATGAIVSGFLPNSFHTFAVVTVDAAGNVSAQSPTAFGTTAMDGAMSTTAQASPAAPDGANGWYITNPTITLTSSPTTVAADTNYAWDASALASYTVPFSAPSDGQHTLSFWSIDKANQRAQEPTQQVIYRVDTSIPSLPTNVVASANSTTSLLVTWTAASDAHSAINHYEVWVDGTMRGTTASTVATVTGLAVNRPYPVHVVAVNGAGLTATTVDVTGTTAANPSISTTCTVAPVAPNGTNGWYVTTPTVTLTTLPSGLPAWAYYSWDSSALTTYTAPFVPPTAGVHELGYHSVDQADSLNRDATSTLTVRMDTAVPAPPTTVHTTTVTTSSIGVEWTAGSDSVSGVHHYILYVNGAPWGSVTGTGTTVPALTPNAFYTFTVATVDTAGNVSAESPSIIQATVALAPLVTTPVVTPAVPDGLNGWYVTTPTVTFSAAPAIPAWTYYCWDGSPMATATGPVQPPSNGTHVLSYWSVDQAGQHAKEATQQITLHQDALPDVRLSPNASPTIEATTSLVTDTEINLVWSPAPASSSGLDHYEVWDDYLGSTTDTSYLVSDLEPMTIYPFKIYGVNNAGTYYSQSATISVETSPPPLPAAPAVVYASALGGSVVNVNWTPAKIRIGEMGYYVWRSEDASNYSRIATVTGQYTNAYTDTGLSSSTRYWYVVSTFDDRGESSMSDSSTAVWPYMAPTTEGAERATGLAAVEGSASVLLSWAPDVNPAVTGYFVTRADRSLGVEATVTPVQVPATITPSFLDTTVTNGQTYWYRVYPVDASSTVGHGSLEKEAKPRTVLSTSTPNPHLVTAAPSNDCQSCHDAHIAPLGTPTLQYVAGGPNEVATCLMCHSPNTGRASMDTSSEVSSALNQSGTDMWLPTSHDSTMTCIDCHRTLVLSQEPTPTMGLLAAGGTTMVRDDAIATQGDLVCYTCHGASSTQRYGDMSDFETSAHFAVASPPSGSEVKCQTCHESHSSRNSSQLRYEGYMGCVQCHSAASTNPNDPDIWTSLTEGEDANTRHSLLPSDQANGSKMSCQNCHNTHSATLANPVVDPHNPSPGTWTGNLDGNTRDYCFLCHDGDPLPTSAETTPWAGAVLGEEATTTAVDIEAAYSVNVHGFATSSNPTTATAMLRTDMGYAVGDTLDCTACHDSHGSTNDFALLPEVKSSDGQSSVSGLLVYRIPAGSITPTSPVGYDLRFFCSSCHVYDVKSHDDRALTDTTEFGKTDCTSCHSHTGPNAVFGNGM
jgi:predicted CXXCH cytochrome family protein